MLQLLAVHVTSATAYAVSDDIKA